MPRSPKATSRRLDRRNVKQAAGIGSFRNCGRLGSAGSDLSQVQNFNATFTPRRISEQPWLVRPQNLSFSSLPIPLSPPLSSKPRLISNYRSRGATQYLQNRYKRVDPVIMRLAVVTAPVSSSSGSPFDLAALPCRAAVLLAGDDRYISCCRVPTSTSLRRPVRLQIDPIWPSGTVSMHTDARQIPVFSW